MFLKSFLIICLLQFQVAFAQTNWELSKDKNGIKVYTASNSTSKFKSIKVEANVEGTLEKLMNILMDVSNNKNWVYNTRYSYLIRKTSKNDILYYAETSLPWPISNRDMIIRMQFFHDTINKTLKVIATGVPDELPEKKGLVRIKYFNGLWDVKYNDENKMLINYILTMEPGGSVPAGITNMFISKGPYETFNNLSNALKK
jgi:hypothetical protein